MRKETVLINPSERGLGRAEALKEVDKILKKAQGTMCGNECCDCLKKAYKQIKQLGAKK